MRVCCYFIHTISKLQNLFLLTLYKEFQRTINGTVLQPMLLNLLFRFTLILLCFCDLKLVDYSLIIFIFKIKLIVVYSLLFGNLLLFCIRMVLEKERNIYQGCLERKLFENNTNSRCWWIRDWNFLERWW
jgi:hypothetical protein